jgi:hypothetical protein
MKLLSPMILVLPIALVAAQSVVAHSGSEHHPTILLRPISGVMNNFWYDYRSDVEEAEIELGKDLRRADTEQDRREAFAEYRQELSDARHDYAKEMRERGYRTGTVTVEGN